MIREGAAPGRRESSPPRSGDSASLLASVTRGNWPRLEEALVVLVAVSPISIAASNIALAVAATLFLRDWRAGRRTPIETPLDGAILIWVAANLLSAITSLDPLRSFRDLKNLSQLGLYSIVAWGVAAGAPLDRLLLAWLGGGLLAALQSLVQRAIGFDLLARGNVKPTGFFGGHLQFGHYTAVLLGVALVLWSEARRHEASWLVVVLLLGAGLTVSEGRGPWLAMAVIAIFWVAWSRSPRALLALVLVVMLQAGYRLAEPEGLIGYYQSFLTFDADAPPAVSRERAQSNLWRITMWREGLKRFALRPISGTGLQTTGELSQDFHTPFSAFGVAHLHSDYFEILMTRGFVGLAAFLLLLLAALAVLLPALARAPDTWARAAVYGGVAGVFGHLAHGFTQFTVGSAPIQMGFCVSLGLATGAAMRGGGVTVPVRANISAVAWGALTLAALVALEPWLIDRPRLVAVLGAAATVDVAAQAVFVGKHDLIGIALTLAWLFVLAAASLLLATVPGGLGVAVKVETVTTAVFAALYAGKRLGQFVVG